jgi:hypothetical protein
MGSYLIGTTNKFIRQKLKPEMLVDLDTGEITLSDPGE